MPVRRKVDSRGPYFQWGTKGHKYYYNSGSVKDRNKAYRKAERQGKAILKRTLLNLMYS